MLEVKKLKKKFGSNVVLNDISFNVSKGDYFYCWPFR